MMLRSVQQQAAGIFLRSKRLVTSGSQLDVSTIACHCPISLLRRLSAFVAKRSEGGSLVKHLAAVSQASGTLTTPRYASPLCP